MGYIIDCIVNGILLIISVVVCMVGNSVSLLLLCVLVEVNLDLVVVLLVMVV